jgi:hypothetical protein
LIGRADFNASLRFDDTVRNMDESVSLQFRFSTREHGSFVEIHLDGDK